MHIKIIRVLAISLVGAILIVGSFVTNNFGISEAYVGWTSLYPPLGAGYVCTFGGCYVEIPPQAPYPLQYPVADISLGLPIDTIAILLITLSALILLHPHLISSKQKRAWHYPQIEDLPYAVREAHFKKYNYRQSDKVLPKRHAKYYKLSTG